VEQGITMDGLREFLFDLKRQDYARENFPGVLNVLIGRQVKAHNGVLVSNGVTWRVLAEWLKKVRWHKEAVRQLGLDPAKLPPRDRLRFWYTAISQAHVDSPEGIKAGDRLAQALASAGYAVVPPGA